jgi:8-oxo-dGTP pyrophosphatase MutT (NUDIX family)
MNQKRKVQVVILATKPGSKKVTQVLLLQTNKKRGGFWQNVTGSVEKFERFSKAALREVWEETGISTDDIHIFMDLKLEHCFKSQKGHNVKEKSFVIVTTEMKIKIDPKEHQDYKWQPIKSIRSTNYKFPTNFESFCLAKKSFKN